MKAVRDDLHVLTGSYVLDALSETEREEFERHLQFCPICDAEVRGLRETAARLALACAVNPPARMERHVLAATYRTRQLPPLAASYVLLFASALGSYSTPWAIIGGGSDLTLMTIQIGFLFGEAGYDLVVADGLSVMIIVLAAASLVAYHMLMSRTARWLR